MTNQPPGINHPSAHPVRFSLPVAPQAVVRSRFEGQTRSGPALDPGEALAHLEKRMALGPPVEVVELEGPGDPLATPDLTLETLDRVRGRFPECILSVATAGIAGDRLARTLFEHGVRRLTMIVDAVDPEGVQQLCQWIRPGKRTIPLAEAAMILLSEQVSTITACKEAGIPVTIRTTVYPGINDHQIEAIARKAAALGAEAIMVLPGLPSADEAGTLRAPTLELMQAARSLAARHLPLVEATVEGASDPGQADSAGETAPSLPLPRPSAERPNVAVVSSNGMAVDLHLGQADRLLIYGPREDGLVCLLDTRIAPEAGGGESRWQRLADLLPDCFALLAVSAGDNPRAILRQRGVPVLITDGEVEGTVDVLYGGGKQSKK